jgi:predicted aconitase
VAEKMNYNIQVTAEEREILNGMQGHVMQKIMKTLVLYGDALGAEKLVKIEGNGHFAIPFALPFAGPSIGMLDELVQAGLKTKYPFTLDPRAPLDFENLGLSIEQKNEFLEIFCDQKKYDKRIEQLGLRDRQAYTCTPYLSEVGNSPKPGTILAWSESSCVVFANSVLGARTNRNGAILDLLSNIAGKTPYIGLLTDAGRKASWLIKVETSALPNPQLIGGAIGREVIEDVPYIIGLDQYLGKDLNDASIDYLKDMGAACASIGAVGLFHVENITPEAVSKKRHLLNPDFNTLIIDDDFLFKLSAGYSVVRKEKKDKPKKCLIGCPHLSLRQITWWSEQIPKSLSKYGREQVLVDTIIFAAPQILKRFRAKGKEYNALAKTGVHLSASCPEAYMNNPECANESVVTNSNKLRAFTPAQFFTEDVLLRIISTGKVEDEE